MKRKDQQDQLPEESVKEIQEEVAPKPKRTRAKASSKPEIKQDDPPQEVVTEKVQDETTVDVIIDEPVAAAESHPETLLVDELPAAEILENTIDGEVQISVQDQITEEIAVLDETLPQDVTDVMPDVKEKEIMESAGVDEVAASIEEPPQPEIPEITKPEIPDLSPPAIPEIPVTEDTERDEAIRKPEDEPVHEVISMDEAEDEEEEAEEHAEEEVLAIDFDQASRADLLVVLENLINGDEDINRIKSRVAQIKVAFLKKTKLEKEEHYQKYLREGGSEEEYHPVEDPQDEQFNNIFEVYRQKRAIFLESLENEKLDNLKKKEAILESLKELINSEETLKKTYDDFRELQESWKNIGMVPKTEVNNLWQNYHFLVERFFDKVKINKELKDLDLRKNLELKIELCEKAEELLMEPSILKSFKQLQRYHDQWKETGPVPADKKDEIWERFKTATDKINQRRRDHYKLLQDEQENNLQAKIALCEKAEALLTEEVDSIRQWQEKTRHFDDLFKIWKTIGPAPKKANDEVWERFKTSLDGFFAEKKEYFGKLKDQQVNNYNLKLDLCMQAEALKDSTDWKNASRDLIKMQQEWREIGPVPRKNADKIWKRFRSACDEFFKRKSDFFSGIRNEESENLRLKEELIKQVETYDFDGAKGENLAVLKDFQRKWTEIGHVPFKDKDRLQSAFRDVINKQLDKLNISNVEMSMATYKSRFEALKQSPDAQRQVFRERSSIQLQVTKLKEDIKLWENNIGFLADSKRANLLKEEFEKKIMSAKKEVELLEAKLKILNK